MRAVILCIQDRAKSSKTELVWKQFTAFVENLWMRKKTPLFHGERKKKGLLVKQNWLCQTCQDLWNMDWDDFSNHLRKADLGVEGLSLDEKVKRKLMELFYDLEQKRRQKKGESHFKKYETCINYDSGRLEICLFYCAEIRSRLWAINPSLRATARAAMKNFSLMKLHFYSSELVKIPHLGKAAEHFSSFFTVMRDFFLQKRTLKR